MQYAKQSIERLYGKSMKKVKELCLKSLERSVACGHKVARRKGKVAHKS